jgi:AcrR family transcriptional regulator
MVADPSSKSQDTQAAIMEATYRALRDHGYADLSISAIGDEFEKSKSVLYYHYDDKDDLLLSFLDYIIDRFSDDLSVETWAEPEAQLEAFFDQLLPLTLDSGQCAFQTALFELRAQAPHDEAYRHQFARTDELIHQTIKTYIEAGIDQGRFREVNPDETASLLLSVINGTMLKRVTTYDDGSIEDLRNALRQYIRVFLKESASP